mmetsp:Transcript_79568/g.158166  ORF Transcript_79568/g.158166 Transcript_79568/m.158166 type:complete len:237 (-) Transcript_79568:334-1044(-)
MPDPEDVAVYGSRGWCRVEYFIFGLSSEISISNRTASGMDEMPPLPLFAVGSEGAVQQFKSVEFLGGDRGDMPSQGEFSFESDRSAIAALERQMFHSYGFAVIRNAVAVATADDGAPCTLDLGAKMLHDEHLEAFAVAAASGSLAKVTTLSFNANPYFKYLPMLTAMPNLKSLSLINCSSLTTIASLVSLPRLETLKLEGCSSLVALPQLPAHAKWDDDPDGVAFAAPDHLRRVRA